MLSAKNNCFLIEFNVHGTLSARQMELACSKALCSSAVPHSSSSCPKSKTKCSIRRSCHSQRHVGHFMGITSIKLCHVIRMPLAAARMASSLVSCCPISRSIVPIPQCMAFGIWRIPNCVLLKGETILFNILWHAIKSIVKRREANAILAD